jgi:excisionase family DNA binding protein
MTQSDIAETSEPQALLLTPAEAGKLMSVSADHVYRLVAKGVLRAVDISMPGSTRSKTRIPREALEQYIQSLHKAKEPKAA